MLTGLQRARIVIVGCGFGGLFAARALKAAPADVLVIDRNNYHLFQPLLYQVAAAALSPADIAQPIRTILRDQQNARVMLAQVDEVNLAERWLTAAGMRVPYDYLVLAPGAVDNYFGNEEWRQFAPGMKAVEEAVEVRLGAAVTRVFADGVEVAGERLRSYNVIWTAGVRAAPLTAMLGVPLDRNGRVLVEPDCSVPGHPEAFVIGDAAWLIDAATGTVVPGVSQGALQMGRYVARLIEAELLGKRSERSRGFHYHDFGSMATVGKSRAVVELGRVRFGGLLAWLAWMTLHITVLIGSRNRLAVLSSWVYSYVFFRRGARLITRPAPPA